MELLVFGHAGARVLVFPTSCGRFYDWENREMVKSLEHHLKSGWLQLFCVDSVDPEAWFNETSDTYAKTKRHLEYQDYVIKEVLPFSQSKNDNPYLIATGASFGAYHAMNIALRFPQYFNRVLAMSGIFDVREWSHGYMDDYIAQASPGESLKLASPQTLEAIKKLDLILPIGREDELYENNLWLSKLMWERGIWHALRVWQDNAHDWPYWQEMIKKYIGGPD